VLLDVEMGLEERHREEIEKIYDDCMRERKSRLPAQPSAGCVFKNPEGGLSAGMIIDRLGLKGMRVGDAAVSDRHGNVIVNVGNATSDEITSLMDSVARMVMIKKGIRLEPEVVVIGEKSV
jgi:UDP-N-acetylmuramate dehydrogenase